MIIDESINTFNTIKNVYNHLIQVKKVKYIYKRYYI